MTYITKPLIEDSEILNSVARDLVFQEGDELKLRRYLKVVTEDGTTHELTFSQLDGMLNILDTARDIPPVTPLQYLVTHYGLTDLVTLGEQDWVVPEYLVMVIAHSKTVRLEGRLTKGGHHDKEFAYALGGFDFLQQLSIARCIAALHKDLNGLVGTFDLDYRLKVDPKGVNVTTNLGL